VDQHRTAGISLSAIWPAVPDRNVIISLFRQGGRSGGSGTGPAGGRKVAISHLPGATPGERLRASPNRCSAGQCVPARRRPVLRYPSLPDRVSVSAGRFDAVTLDGEPVTPPPAQFYASRSPPTSSAPSKVPQGHGVRELRPGPGLGPTRSRDLPSVTGQVAGPGQSVAGSHGWPSASMTRVSKRLRPCLAAVDR